MARKLTYLIRQNHYLNALPPEMACGKVYSQLAEKIRSFDMNSLNSEQTNRLQFYKISTTSTRDFYVGKFETPNRQKCENLITLIEVLLGENIPDNHTEKWTTIRDFWYRVHKSSAVKGHSNVELVLDPIARLSGYMNFFDFLEKEFRENQRI
jgi:hypothetical protein